MSIDGIRKGLAQAQVDGKVDVDEVDRLMVAVRDGGGLDAAERAELLRASNSFDDVSKQRVLMHLSAMGQKSAWVNVDGEGHVASVQGRQATLSVGVRGLSAKVGLFDNSLSVKGTATSAGTIKLVIEGQRVSVKVARGETAAQVLEKVRAALPEAVTGLVLQGDVQPFDHAEFMGNTAAQSDTAAHLMMYKPEALGLKPGERPLRVVVTGYGAFLGLVDNPSANMAQQLAEAGVKGAIVEYRRLDVTPAAVDAFIAEMKKSPPDVILSMGVGGQAQVEERPENVLGAGVDGLDQPLTPGPIRPGGAQELSTDLPVDVVEWGLKPFKREQQVFTSLSDPNYEPDRSQYLCNYLGYNLATEFGKQPETTAGFMHVTAGTPVNQMHGVLEALTAHQLEWKRAQSSPNS
jgi:pyrrolidone-carboxylate peptidase